MRASVAVILTTLVILVGTILFGFMYPLFVQPVHPNHQSHQPAFQAAPSNNLTTVLEPLSCNCTKEDEDPAVVSVLLCDAEAPQNPDNATTAVTVDDDPLQCGRFELLYQPIRDSVRNNNGSVSFSAFQDTLNDCLRMGKSCMRMQLIRGQLYVSSLQQSYSNILLNVQFLFYTFVSGARAANYTLPDVEFIVTTSDANVGQIEPHFVYLAGCTVDGSKRFVMPDFSFWAYHDHALSSWFAETERMNAASKFVEFEQRTPKALYRGGPSSTLRFALIKLGETAPAEVDAQMVSGADRGSGLYVSQPDHCRWRYLPYAPGISYSVRLKYFMLCESVVFMPSNYVYSEFWVHLLKDNVTMLKTGDDFANMTDLIRDIESSPEKLAHAKDIGRRGAELVRYYLQPAALQCYFTRLIQAYHTVTGWPVVKAADAVTIEYSVFNFENQL